MPVNKEALALVEKINKEMKERTVVIASEMVVSKRYLTGSLSLDVATGGGWPANQWVEVLGKESHGKTAMVYKGIAANQAVDPEFTVVWVAAEHYDYEWATDLGVDNDRVIVISTRKMEFAYQKVLEFAKSRAIDWIVIDSYPALIPDEEGEKDMDEFSIGLGARLTGKFFRKAGEATARSMDGSERPMLGIMINQWRDDIGGFSPRGPAQTSPGGKGKNYAFYVRVDVRRDEWIDEPLPGQGKIRVGQRIKVKTIKNKSAAPYQIASIDFYFRDAPQSGFSKGDYDEAKESMTMGILFDVIERHGAYYSFDGNRWQGKDAMFAAFREDLDMCERLRVKVLEVAKNTVERSITEEDITAAETSGTRTVARR